MKEHFNRLIEVFRRDDSSHTDDAPYQEGDSREKPESDTIPERLAKRKNRITGHLENIYRAQGRLESIEHSWFPLPRDLKRGDLRHLKSFSVW